MKIAGLIVAAGRGQRVGGEIPKQYRHVAGKTVLRRSIEALLSHARLDAIAVVIHPDDTEHYSAAVSGLNTQRLLAPVIGGDQRHISVKAGLNALTNLSPDQILIHDAARPFLDQKVIERVLRALENKPAAFPALPVVDALWHAEGMTITAPQKRENMWRAQTPQGFDFPTIYALHNKNTDVAADDVSLAHNAGVDVEIVLGDARNFKITTAEDIVRAENLADQNMDIRTGNGYDVHAFCAGDAVTLCGVEISHSHGLKGHSDADVAMHALTDAIFGALAEGDIGQWFPPSEPEWKGAASTIFHQKSVSLASERGFEISHLDCTIICEEPKIAPHTMAMRAKIAEISNLPIDRVSIKATTSEKLGFTGRSEGIAAQATATLVKR